MSEAKIVKEKEVKKTLGEKVREKLHLSIYQNKEQTENKEPV
jgi:hypothetical protein